MSSRSSSITEKKKKKKIQKTFLVTFPKQPHIGSELYHIWHPLRIAFEITMIIGVKAFEITMTMVM
jgi:hypothetical protein